MSEVNVNTREYWDGRHAEAEHLWDPMDIVTRIAGFLRPGWKVLDVGVGSGTVLLGVAELLPKLRLMACDISQNAIDRLAGRCGPGRFERLFVHDIREPFRDPLPIAHAVISTETLEHLEDPASALRNMAEVADEMVIVSVPNLRTIPSREHLWEFAIDDVRELLAPYGRPWAKHVRRNRNLLGMVRMESCRS